MGSEFWDNIFQYLSQIDLLEFAGLVFGLLCVIFLILEHILTWICGIIYVVISFFIFWQARLYGDFILHIFFLILNIYGWYYWSRKDNETSERVPITKLTFQSFLIVGMMTWIGVLIFAQFLKTLPHWIVGLEPASLPFWDSLTSIFSVTGMWLTARKKIDNWYYWFVVDVLATGIYFHKELYFYSALYFIYIGLAVAGYLAWRKTYRLQIN